MKTGGKESLLPNQIHLLKLPKGGKKIQLPVTNKQQCQIKIQIRYGASINKSREQQQKQDTKTNAQALNESKITQWCRH